MINDSHQETIDQAFVVKHSTGYLNVDSSRGPIVIHFPHMNSTSGPHFLIIKKVSLDKNKITLVGDKCKFSDGGDIIVNNLVHEGYLKLRYDGKCWERIRE